MRLRAVDQGHELRDALWCECRFSGMQGAGDARARRRCYDELVTFDHLADGIILALLAWAIARARK
jgi:hypothetical protein